MSERLALWGTCWHIVQDARLFKTACGLWIPKDATVQARSRVPSAHYICARCRATRPDDFPGRLTSERS